MAVAAHLVGLVYGLAAGVFSLTVFFAAGLLFTPRRWQQSLRWPDTLIAGLTLFVLLCWIAVSARRRPNPT